MLDVDRLWDEAEIVWGAWQPGYGADGMVEFRSGAATITRHDLSTETTTVVEQRLYLQTRYLDEPGGGAMSQWSATSTD